MAIALPLNQNDIYRIVHDFDQHHFNTSKLLRKDQVDQVIVITQFEKFLKSHFPVVIVDMIMRRHLENSPSVGALLMFYRNTPALGTKHFLILSKTVHYLNNASELLLLRLNQQPSTGNLASYQQLMTTVFKHHFDKLTLGEKLELVQRNSITPWQQKTTGQKLEFLGRIQAPTLWGQAKVKLQLLSWRVQYAAAWALENNVIIWTLTVMSVTVPIISVAFLLGSFSTAIATSAIFLSLRNTWIKVCIYGLLTIAASLAASLASTGVGLALRISIFPTHIREKGAWIQSISWKSFLLNYYFLLSVLPAKNQNSNQRQRILDELFNTSKELQALLLQSVNQANITVGQTAFVNAQLPELLDKWLILTSP